MKKSSQRKFIYLGVVALLLLLTACATTPRVLEVRSDVDALATKDAQNKRHFVVLPGNKALKEQDLQFIEFKAYVEKALIASGFSKADSPQDGDVVLFLDYGVGEPQSYQYAYDVPVWNNMGFYPFYRRYGYYPMMSSYYYAPRVETYLVYKRYLSLEAYDMAAYLQQKTPIQLWKISVQSLGTSNDLRLTLPYMITAMKPYVGINTGHMVNIEINEHDPFLRELLLSNPNPAPSVQSPQQKTPTQ
ncbi:MAG: hypothetical protein ACU836_16075 [Gammaproteobacteria bacterium]